VGLSVKGIRTATAISAGSDQQTCAVLSDKTARCWGYNRDGQLGNGTGSFAVGWPVPVKGIRTATAISAGGRHTCALLSHGKVACWGLNASGQLGSSPWRRSGTPVVVEGP
jgi:alpha-tubulin suppressor-like RCC1 family protein